MMHVITTDRGSVNHLAIKYGPWDSYNPIPLCNSSAYPANFQVATQHNGKPLCKVCRSVHSDHKMAVLFHDEHQEKDRDERLKAAKTPLSKKKVTIGEVRRKVREVAKAKGEAAAAS